MARRNRKTGRYSSTKRRSRRTKAFNISKAAETALVANAAIKGLFGTNLPTFLTGKDLMNGFNNGVNNSNEFTLPELFDGLIGGNAGIAANWKGENGDTSILGGVKANMRLYGTEALTQMIVLPIAFKIGRKVLAKPLINPTNRALRSVGLGKEVKL